MSETIFSGRSRSALLLKWAAWFVVLSYVVTAQYSQGEQADFARMWLGARLVASGAADQLYDQARQKQELEPYFDAAEIERLRIEGVGWVTYPPAQAVLYAPLGLISPQTACWCMVELSILAMVITSWLVARLTRFRVPVALVILAFLLSPTFFFNLGLGQNASFTALMIALGWMFLVDRRSIAAGLVWGLFLYKPTWGLAVAWVPFVVGQPRAYVGLALSAVGLLAASAVVCGYETWWHWLDVASRVNAGYADSFKWQLMRRDLTGLISHLIGPQPAARVGNVALLGVLAITAISWRRRSLADRWSGRPVAMLLSAIVLSCPRFMYYDALLIVLPLVVMWSDRRSLSAWDKGFLTTITLLFYGAIILTAGAWPVCWPIETACALALWCWTVVGLHDRYPKRVVAR